MKTGAAHAGLGLGIQMQHLFDLGIDLAFDLGEDALLEAGALAGGALAQRENNGALDEATLLQLRCRLGGNVPGTDHLQTRRPEDAHHVRPDGSVLVSEHHTLHAVVGHVLGHRLVGIDHAAAEVVARALDGEVTA